MCDICLEETTKKFYICQFCNHKCCENCLKYYLDNHNGEMKIYCFNCNNLIDVNHISDTIGKKYYDNFMHNVFEFQLKQLNINYGYMVDKFKKQLEIKCSSINEEMYDIYELYHFKIRKWKPFNSRKNNDDNRSYFKVLSDLHTYVNNPNKTNKKQLKISVKSSIYKISKIVIEELYSILKNKTDKLLSYYEFLEIRNYIKNKNYEINNLFKFVEDEFKTMNTIDKQNIFIKRCEECGKGIIQKIINSDSEFIYECNNCKSEYCINCLEKIYPNHQCDENNIETVKEIFKNSQPCPICATRIEKSSGCDNMYCTYCKTGFRWDTFQIIKTNFHNEHRMKDIADKKLTPNLPDLLCSKFYSMIHSKQNFMKYIDEKNRISFEKIYKLATNKELSYNKRIKQYTIEFVQNYIGLMLQSELINPINDIDYYYDSYRSFEKIFELSHKENEIKLEKVKHSICYDFLIELDQYLLLNDKLQPDFDIKIDTILNIIN